MLVFRGSSVYENVYRAEQAKSEERSVITAILLSRKLISKDLVHTEM
jgi:hypothetical protein